MSPVLIWETRNGLDAIFSLVHKLVGTYIYIEISTCPPVPWFSSRLITFHAYIFLQRIVIKKTG